MKSLKVSSPDSLPLFGEELLGELVPLGEERLG
jgi:hypothetical protein